jgi:steroid 5-alpha reductase family enzyme
VNKLNGRRSDKCISYCNSDTKQLQDSAVPLIFTAGLGIWIVLAVSWLFVMPAEASGKTWHYIHAVIPGAVLLIDYLAPASLQPVVNVFLEAGIVIFLCMALTWIVGQMLGNHSIMDIAYPLTCLIGTAYLFVAAGPVTFRKTVLLALVVIWTLRLLSHTIRTNFRVEQQPYAGLRKRYGARWPLWSFYSVYMLQGVICWVWLSSQAFGMSVADVDLSAFDIAGVAIWLMGFTFQAVGDHQLKEFKSHPENAGKLMQSGLWSITRHPNYFGETVMWTGYFLFALDHSWGWISIVSPLYVGWFMCFGSAIPGNERHMRKTRPEYDAYARRVARFVPWLRFSRG